MVVVASIFFYFLKNKNQEKSKPQQDRPKSDFFPVPNFFGAGTGNVNYWYIQDMRTRAPDMRTRAPDMRTRAPAHYARAKIFLFLGFLPKFFFP